MRLLGARPIDHRAARPATVEAFGEKWSIGAYPRDMRVELTPDQATVLVRDQDSLPVILTHQVERGRVTYALPLVDASAAEVADDRQARSRWKRWYGGMLKTL